MLRFRKRKKTPTILQMEAAECGAAALNIILSYYGRYISLEQMRIDCAVSRDGCSAVNMLQAARWHGMIARAAKVEDLTALSELKVPFIVFWDFNHFVVVEGISGKKFYINDPASGARTLDYEEFDHSFTGIVLAIEPGPEFKPEGNPPSLYNALKNRLRGSHLDLLFIVLASLALIVPNLIFPGLIKIFIDDIIIENTRGWILPFFSVFILTTIMVGILVALQQYNLLRLRIKLLLVTSVAFLWHVICLPVNFFHQRYAGDVSERIAANDRISELLSNELSTAMVSVISMIFYALVMFLISWQLSLIGLGTAIFNYLVYLSIARRYADISRNIIQQDGKLTGIEMNGLHIIEDFKANGSENDFFQRWSGLHANLITLEQKQGFYSTLMALIPEWSVSISFAIMLGYGSVLIMQGQLTIGTLIAFQVLLSSFNLPFYTLLGFAEQIQEIKGDLSRLDDVNNYPIDKRLTIPLNNIGLKPSVSMQGVSFSYSPLSPPVIVDINFEIKAGERVAIIGKTGGGKSTIAKLVCGLYSPQKGSIFIGDVPLKEISSSDLAKILSFVDQDIFIYSGTIKDNLTLWKKEIPDDVIEKALKDACLWDVVMSRGGLDVKVIEGGANFSGGQRQRLEIARALAMNPKLLIMDEATSNLDAETERNILTNIKNRGCTTFIITHRIAAIQDCDRIFKISQGKLVEELR